jgi:hypothetical protein
MSEYSDFLPELFDIAFDRPVVMHRVFAELTGSAAGGIFLSQAVYWSNRTDDPDGWFYKCRREWWEETALKRREIEGASAILVRLGILEMRVEGSPQTTFYRLNKHILQEQCSYAATQLKQKVKSKKITPRPQRTPEPIHVSVCANCLAQMSQSIGPNEPILTEITAESISETTIKRKVSTEVLTKEVGDTSGEISLTQKRAKPTPELTPDALMDLYNSSAPDDHPKIELYSPERQKKAREYLSAFPQCAFWERVFAEIHLSNFLRGKVSSPGHKAVKRGFDWLLTRGKDGLENCVKVYEGKYRDVLNLSDNVSQSTPSDLAQRFRTTLNGGQRNV